MNLRATDHFGRNENISFLLVRPDTYIYLHSCLSHDRPIEVCVDENKMSLRVVLAYFASAHIAYNQRLNTNSCIKGKVRTFVNCGCCRRCDDTRQMLCQRQMTYEKSKIEYLSRSCDADNNFYAHLCLPPVPHTRVQNIFSEIVIPFNPTSAHTVSPYAAYRSIFSATRKKIEKLNFLWNKSEPVVQRLSIIVCT